MSAAPQLQPSHSLSVVPALIGSWDRLAIGRALIDNCSFAEACIAIANHALRGGPPAHVITANAQHVVLLNSDSRLRDIYHRAGLVVADGVSLVLAARLLGRRLEQRIPGVDLFQTLCDSAARNHLRVFLLGGRPGSADLAAKLLKQRFARLNITTYCPPLGFERDDRELRKVDDAILSARPDFLFVGLGAPKQEYWIHDHSRKLGIPVSIGVGGTFEMVAGVVRRAPAWVQSLGCEWLYRLCLEPRRMWRRYLVGNVEFCWTIVKQRFRRVYLRALMTRLSKGPIESELHDSSFREEARLLAARLTTASRDDQFLAL